MFGAFNEGMMAPGGSASEACDESDSWRSLTSTEATATRWRAISTATVGGAADKKDGLFNEGNLVDLAERCCSLEHLFDSRFPQESHAFFVSSFLDFR
jgi:hypothetical protein